MMMPQTDDDRVFSWICSSWAKAWDTRCLGSKAHVEADQGQQQHVQVLASGVFLPDPSTSDRHQCSRCPCPSSSLPSGVFDDCRLQHGARPCPDEAVDLASR